MTFPEEALTTDRFLGGRLSVFQPRDGYRAGVDPVFLAAAVPANAGETVLELGCGAGVASLCLAKRVTDLGLTGVELQDSYAALARRNAAENGIPMEVVTADLAALPAKLRARDFDHVIANPPYFPPGHGTPAQDAGRQTALAEATPLSTWIDIATKRLRPGGRLTLIQRTERLPDLLRATDTRLGSIELRPLAPREGRPARLILFSAIKGGRAPFTLHAPIVLHDGPQHARDGDDYTALARRVLRDGAAWPGVAD